MVTMQAPASLRSGDSSDEDQPSPRVNARLISHKEVQHRGSPD